MRLNHRGVVKYVAHFEDENSYVLITELCSYGSLRDLLDRRTRLTEPEVQFFMLQILDAVEYMHSQLVIHRDLKPENIFVQKGFSIRIGDFGLSAPLSDPKQHCQ